MFRTFSVSLLGFWLTCVSLLPGEAFIASYRSAVSTRLHQSDSDQRDKTVPKKSTDRTSSVVTTTVVQDLKAGEDGYSLLRQPLAATSWDPNVQPGYKPPQVLDEKQDESNQANDAWWQARQNPSKQRTVKDKAETSVPSKIDKDDNPINEKDFNLLQRSLDTLDFPRILNALQGLCTTAPARRIVEEAYFASTPRQMSTSSTRRNGTITLLSSSAVGARARYRAVEEMQWLLQGGHDMVRLDGLTYKNSRGFKQNLASPPPLGNLAFDWHDSILVKLNQGLVLEADDLIQIRLYLEAMENVVAWGKALRNVEDVDFVELPSLVDGISLNVTLQDLLNDAFEVDRSTQQYRLSGKTFPTIGRLRVRIKELRSSILDTLDGLVALPSMQSKLALESGGAIYSEVSGGRLVIPVTPSEASRIGIVHDTSRSGKTVYVEPTEIVGPTNELRQVEAELKAEEARVWRQLTQQIVANQDVLSRSIEAVGAVDLALARLRLGEAIGGIIPTVKEEGVINLKQAKHPVLLLRGIPNVVGSDVSLGVGDNQGLVLTGPNSGGKTIILKLLGLVALMAKGGIPIPASCDDDTDDMTRVDFFDPVLADIGDIQSVGGDLSTFSGHMLVCREVLNTASKNALVLMDEVGSGTDPTQGVAIAQALLEALVDVGARVAITTHYMQLKQLAAADDRFAVGGMQFVGGRPTYKLLPGTVGESFALAVAERLELPRRVLDRANELLDSETRQMGDLIRELEDQKALIDQKAEEMEQRLKEMKAMEFKMKEELVRMEKKQLTVRRDEARKFAQKLEEKELILEQILEKLKSDPSRKLVAKSWNDLKYVKRDALNEAENIPSVLARKDKEAAQVEKETRELVPIAEMREKPVLSEGDKVIICKKGPLFAREGIIVRVMGNRVEARLNNMNMAFKNTDIALPVANGPKPSASKSPKSDRVESISKAANRALSHERRENDSEWEKVRNLQEKSTESKQVAMRTDANTVDVRGCNLLEAQEKIKDKISLLLMNGRNTVYVLHGHGTGGVLKSKIRNWLKTERSLVKRWQPADKDDGGDAFTRVELK